MIKIQKAMKQQKKQLKKEQMEREEQIKEKIKEAHKLLTVLDSFGDEVVRNDFLNETNGAFVSFVLLSNDLKEGI